MLNQKEYEVEQMSVFHSFIQSLIENIDRGMTVEELREFLVRQLK